MPFDYDMYPIFVYGDISILEMAILVNGIFL